MSRPNRRSYPACRDAIASPETALESLKGADGKRNCPMTIQDRERQLRIVAEILLVHLPDLVTSDPELARDLLSVVGTALYAIHEDAEQSAKAWDKRAYHVRADEMRREWDWALGAANYALGLVSRSERLDTAALAKLRALIRPQLEKPARRQITDPERFRGAARAVKTQQAQKRKPVRW